jgi:hypothetical protein
MEQIDNVSKYIQKHRSTIDKSWNKIGELQKNIKNISDNRLITQYQQVIERYKSIIELENAKIDFYIKALDELLLLKQNHIYTQNLIAEKQELEKLESSILEKSYKEAYETNMSVDDFLLYENTYLEALKEYSDELSLSGDVDLFEEVIEKFKTKTALL